MMATATETAREMDLDTWMATRLKIVDKKADLIPFVPNKVQMGVMWQMSRQQEAGVPVRLLILKARQTGVSTLIEGIIFSLCANQANRFGEVVAHLDDSATVLFEMSRRFETHLPPAERKPLERSSRKEIAWAAPHGSRMSVHTAGAARLDEESRTGRSKTIHYLHASEVPYWSDQSATLTALLQCVPYEPGTIVCLEFTANGAGGEAYERWQKAYQWQKDHPGDVSGYIPVFISWLSAPEYALYLDDPEDLRPLDQEEERLQRLGATLENLKWRRQILRDQFNGDEDKFRQEYPATPDEAFQVSGRPAIPACILRHHEKTVRAPEKYLVLERGPSGEVRARDATAEAETAWHVWADPEPGEDYIVAGDCPEGRVSDSSDPRSEPDFATGMVLRRRDLATVATFRAHIEPDYLGEQLCMMGERYNHAWASPEINAAGMAALAIFTRRSYARLYRRKPGADSLVTDEIALLGWKTTANNRDLLIDTYIAYARPDPIGEWRERIQVLDVRILDEERTFVRKVTGKREHQAGACDDLLFALFIALQLHLDCPRVREPKPEITVNPKLRGLAYAGGLDQDFDEDEDEEQMP
jgi:hypothetical protein